MARKSARRRGPDRRDEDDERGPLISEEPRPFEQLEDWQKPRELPSDPSERDPDDTEGQRSSAGRKAH